MTKNKQNTNTNPTQSMHTHLKLFQLAKGVHGFLSLSVTLSLAVAVVVIVQMYLLSQIIAVVFMDEAHPDTWFLMALGASIVLRSLLVWIRERYCQIKAVSIKSNIRKRLFESILRHGPMAQKKEKTGNQVNLIMNGVEKLDDYFTRYIPSIIHIAILPFTIIVFALYYDWLSGLILLVTGPLILFFMFLIGTYAKSISDQQWGKMSRLSSHFLDVLQGMKTLKTLGVNEVERENLNASSDAFRLATMRVLQLAFLSGMVLELAASISIALVAVQIGIRLIEGLMVFQAGLFILLLTPEFYIPFRLLGQHHHAGMEGVAAAKDIFAALETSETSEIMKYDFPMSDGSKGIKTNSPPEIIIQNLCYTYPGNKTPALNNVSGSIRSGEKTALVGATGSGKSTLVYHILGQLKAQSGSIDFFFPLQNIKLNKVKTVAYVAQHPYFFNASIANNLLMACDDATEAEIIFAAKKARAHDFIQKLPMGYDTLIHENASELSGGERQRLAIARAFLSKAPLVILDEPTSNLDFESENLITEAVNELTKNKTSIIIAHRLQTIKKADTIWVMHKGKIAEEGKHKELFQKNGIYAQYIKTLGIKL